MINKKGFPDTFNFYCSMHTFYRKCIQKSKVFSNGKTQVYSVCDSRGSLGPIKATENKFSFPSFSGLNLGLLWIPIYNVLRLRVFLHKMEFHSTWCQLMASFKLQIHLKILQLSLWREDLIKSLNTIPQIPVCAQLLISENNESWNKLHLPT